MDLAVRLQSDTRPEGPKHRSGAALISVCLGFFVIQLDVTIVNVALPAIQREIGGSLAGLQWVIDAYTLALAAIMLTAGSAADRIGARKVFAAGLTVFAVGSAACAAAPTLGVLIAARAVQGLGASALLPCSLALLVHQFPDPRARARALGVWGGMGSLGVALGPVIAQHVTPHRRVGPAAGGRCPRGAHRGLHHRRPAGLARPRAGCLARRWRGHRGAVHAGRAPAGCSDAAASALQVQEPQRGDRGGPAVQPVHLRHADLPVAVLAAGAAR